MRILGIDPAINVTGYGLLEVNGSKMSLRSKGLITTKGISGLSKKLERIYDGLIRLVQRYRPDYIVIEKLYSHYRHPTTCYYLGQVQGLIRLICEKKSIPLVEYGSTRIKKAIIGRGNASKSQVQKMVEYLLSLKEPIKSFDISDAISLAIAHAYIIAKNSQQSVNKKPETSCQKPESGYWSLVSGYS